MPRILFEKTGNAVWISHLDLMRLFQRAFKRAGLPLTHSGGFSPRPQVSIAMPLSVGVESRCELLDYTLDGMELPAEELIRRLNAALIPGVRVLAAYNDCRKIREITYLDCCVTLEYDGGVPAGAVGAIQALFASPSLILEKKGKNGPTQQDIIPMIRSLQITPTDGSTLALRARICCQNPSLNPAQLCAAIDLALPHLHPDHSRICRLEILDAKEEIFR